MAMRDTCVTGRWRAAALCALLAIAVAGATAMAAVETWHVRLASPSAASPMLYLEVRSSRELRIADSPAALATAVPLMATQRTENEQGIGLSQYLTFPQVVLPVSLPPMDKVSALVTLNRSRSRDPKKGIVSDLSTIEARVVMSRRDAQGAQWQYFSTVKRPDLPTPQFAAAPQQAPVLGLPDPGKLELTVVTKIEGNRARIALQPKAGGESVDKVLRNGRPPVCTLQVLDASGKVVHTAKGDLVKFGFT
jgi:hypothetical protein